MDFTKSLKPGTKIEIEFQDPDGNLKLQTLIDQPLKDGFFTVFTPMNKGTFYPARVGSTVKITFLHSGKEKKEPFSFSAKIEDRKSSGTSSILKMSLVSSIKKSQRRESFRLSLVKTISYEYEGFMHEMITKDVSSTGFKALVEKEIHEGEVITLKLPVEDEILNIDAKITYSQRVPDSIKKVEIRGPFINIDEATKKKISRFLLEKQSESVRKNLDANGYSELFKLLNYENERRKTEDFNIVMVRYLTLASWIICMFQVSSFLNARPRMSYGVERFFSIYMGSHWNLTMMNIFLLLTVVQLCITIYGLTLNSTRLKRATDKISKSLIINLTLSVIGIIAYFAILNIILQQ